MKAQEESWGVHSDTRMALKGTSCPICLRRTTTMKSVMAGLYRRSSASVPAVKSSMAPIFTKNSAAPANQLSNWRWAVKERSTRVRISDSSGDLTRISPPPLPQDGSSRRRISRDLYSASELRFTTQTGRS